MKKFIFFFCFLFFSTVSICQLVYPYQDIKLEKPSDYIETEPLALSAANFLLTTPFDGLDANRNNALKFLSTWMTGTKAYNFYMKGKIMDLGGDLNVLSLYLAAMVKYGLENKEEAVNPLNAELHTSKIVLAYCDDPKNNLKLKKKYRKILETN